MTEQVWRELRDPHVPNYPGFSTYWYAVWRCRALTLEFQWRQCDNDAPWEGRWFTRTTPGHENPEELWQSTPEREAIWLDLFLRP